MSKPTAKPATVKLTLEQTALLWRLHRGGITDNQLLRRITGLNAHGMALRGAINAMDRALLESLPLKEYVRCRGCGGLITTIPCISCGPHKDAYRFTGKVVANTIEERGDDGAA